MKKLLIIFSILLTAALGIAAYTFIHGWSKQEKLFSNNKIQGMLPRVLFLTTGNAEGNGGVSEGVDIAIESFTKRGAYVHLDNREVLLQPEILSGYSVIVAMTSIGYHDGDRQYSLTFLSDIEMQNLTEWVRDGGVLIAEENIGRNTLDGTDRVNLTGELNKDTWKLSELFGVKMKETDLNGFLLEEKNIKIWNGIIKQTVTEDEWVLTPIEITSDKIKILAEWKNGTEVIPGILQNDFGKGKSFLLTATYLLHPSNDGGVSGIKQIENFYDYVLNSVQSNNKFPLELNTWPGAYTSAFCITFNSQGSKERYENVLNFLKTEKLKATFFIDSLLMNDEKNLLDENKNISVQTGLYSKTDYMYLNYSEVVRAFLMNEQMFGKKFTGLRFPYSNPNYRGLIYAAEHGFIYDSSIGADYLENFTGSVIPYNIPVSKDSYYKTLKLLEICPVKNSDEFYFGKIASEKDYSDEMLRNASQLFEKYLFDFYQFAIKENNGLMVFEGHPEFTGINEITMLPLKRLADSLRIKNCWLSTLEEVASFRNKLSGLILQTSETENGVLIKINSPPEDTLRGLSIKLKSKPLNVNSSAVFEIKEVNGIFYLVCDVKNNDEFEMTF